MFEYCPCEIRFKSKVGGVKANEPFSVSINGHADNACLILTKEGEGHQPVSYPMDKIEGGFTVKLCITTTGLYFYYFLIDGIRYGADELLNLKAGGDDYLQLVYEGEFRCLSGGVIYQIMPDRFFAAKPINVKKGAHYAEDWYKVPSYLPDKSGNYNKEFFGGNLRGITAKLDYLKDLGVTYIYLNPIFEASSNHKYDTGDYEKIDGSLGTESDFDNLVNEAKKRGIGIILDGVFSHTGADSRYFNRFGSYDEVGAFQSKQSRYYEWYRFSEFPFKYNSWWGFESLPEVDETAPSYMGYMLGEKGVVAKWDAKGIAGWRLDVADELPNEFLYKLHIRTSGVLIGEVWENAARKFAYGDRRRYFLGGQLDGVTNYPFRNAIINYILSGDNTLLRKAVRELISDYPPDAFCSIMNVLGTHDTDRILTALSHDVRSDSKADRASHVQTDIEEATRRLKLASLIQYILPGVPCVFYGDEAGLSGYEDPFCRKSYPWGRENVDLISHYKMLGKIRAKYFKALSGAAIDVSPNDKIFTLVRKGGGTTLTLTVNLSDKHIELDGVDLLSGKKVVISGEAALVERKEQNL